jgi:phosphoribosyl 1,2-cyclic phosphate phosphodiesterase
MDAATSTAIHARFGYCFATPEGNSYPPILTEHRIHAGKPVTIEGEGGGITALPFEHMHGDTDTLGFRIGGLAYSCDVSDIPNESLDALRDLDVWIVDALRYTTHPSHFSLEQSLAWIERIRPRRAILTNLHSDSDYEKLRREIPANVEPAFDGMQIELPG